MQIISLLGPPGAGKDTQAQILANKHQVKVIKVGALVRNVESGEIQAKLAQGELVDHQFVENLVEDKLSKLNNGHQVIIDGFPRDLEQVELFNSSQFVDQLEHVVLLEIPPRESKKRIKKRLAQEQRSDDDWQTFQHRLEVYQNQTLPVVAHYRKQGLLREVDGVGTIEEVTNRLEAALDL